MQILMHPNSGDPYIGLWGRYDAHQSNRVAELLSGPVESGWTVLVDLSRVEFMDDTFLGMLLDAQSIAPRHGGCLHLCEPSPAALEAFERIGAVPHLTDPSLLTRERATSDPA